MKFAAFFLCLLLSNLVFAEDDSSTCEFGTREQMLSGQCLCTKNFPKKDIPKDFSFDRTRQLVHVCGFVPIQKNGLDSGVSGMFLFRVNEVVDGTAEYSVGSEGSLYFHAKNGSASGWLESESDETKELGKLKSSHLSLVDGASVKSVLRIKEFYIQYDSGSVNRRGITKYDVIKTGKHR